MTKAQMMTCAALAAIMAAIGGGLNPHDFAFDMTSYFIGAAAAMFFAAVFS
jgi:hypothetical protein